MVPKIIRVDPKPKYKLHVQFKGEGKRLFDVKPYLNKGIFKELRDDRYFNKARVVWGGIEWPHSQDLSAETLYLLSMPLKNSEKK